MSQTWSEHQLLAVVSGGESNCVDFKRQWYDFQRNEDKAEFARDMLAFVNTATPTQSCFLIVGVDDTGSIVGAGAGPTVEAMVQSLAIHTMPPVAFTHAQVTVGGQKVDVLEIGYSAFRPHYALRDSGKLKRDTVYVRRGSTIGTLTLPEIAAMIREPGGVVKADPLQLGFIEYINWASGMVTARVMNLTEEPIGGIHLVVEIMARFGRHGVIRRTTFFDATFKPRESRDIAIDVVEMMTSVDKSLRPRDDQKHRWVDVTLWLTYRDRSGFVRSTHETICLGN